MRHPMKILMVLALGALFLSVPAFAQGPAGGGFEPQTEEPEPAEEIGGTAETGALTPVPFKEGGWTDPDSDPWSEVTEVEPVESEQWWLIIRQMWRWV